MKHVCVFSIVVLSMTVFSVYSQETDYTNDVNERIRLVEHSLAGWVITGTNDTWSLQDRMKHYNIPGVSIAVIHDGRIEWAKGYGFADLSEQRPVTANTRFQAASISKSLNSLGVLKLAQEKTLDLKTDVNQYLHSWKFPYDEKFHQRAITLAELLSHTGGLSVSGFPGYEKGLTLPTIPQILDGQYPANTDPVRSIAEPGRNVIYSGGGITLSQMVVMDVTHQSYEDYMLKNVLVPLGMTHSSFSQPPDSATLNLLATGYRPDGNEVSGKYHIYPEQAAAGLWTTPSDLAKYIIETQQSLNGMSAKVLGQEMQKLRLTPVLEDAALGTFVNSRVTGSFRYFNHNGGNEGFCCTAIGCMNQAEGVVIMTNTDYNNNGILEEIANSVAQVYHWKDYFLPEKKIVIIPDVDSLEKYVGIYDLNGLKITIKRSQDGLLLNAIRNLFSVVYFSSPTEFFVREARGMLKFISDPEGKVTGLTFNGNTAKKIE